MEQNGQFFSFPFNNELFSINDVTYVSEKVEKNISILFGDDKYMKIDKNLSILNLKLNSLLNDPELKLFHKYVQINTDVISYQNCLAYYLGFQFGLKINDLK